MHRLRIPLRIRKDRWKQYQHICDRLIKHHGKCSLCQKEQPCETWDGMHQGFLEAKARTRVLDYDKP